MPAWRDAFVRLQERGRVVFTAAIDGSVYAKHGTTFPTRLTVIDKTPADDPAVFPRRSGLAPDVATLLGWIERRSRHGCRSTLPKLHAELQPPHRAPCAAISRARPPRVPPCRHRIAPEGVELAYETVDWTPPEGGRLTRRDLRGLRLPVDPHSRRAGPSDEAGAVCRDGLGRAAEARLSAAAAGRDRRRRLLSDAQLETVIYAGEAHADHLAGSLDASTRPSISSARRRTTPRAPSASGAASCSATAPAPARAASRPASSSTTGCKGRRKAVWISKSDKLIEDAQRDWSALGMERLLVTPLSRFPQGTPITLAEGILFTTYATLRSDDRGEKVSRVRQIVDWLGADFDGVIVFDESPRHAERRRRQGRSGRRRPLAAGPRRSAPAARAAGCPRPLCLGDRRHHRPQSRLCPAARPLGRRGLPLRHAGRVRRGDRGRRRRGDGGAGARPALARPLHRALALLRRRRIRAGRAPADRTSSAASTTPMPAPSPSSTTISTRRWRRPTSPAARGR